MVDFDVRFVSAVNASLVTQRLIRNPNYGGSSTVVRGACVIPIKFRDIKPKFFEALKENVKLDGFRNPILLYATPEGLLLSFGGSRLKVARELDKFIPAIVVDYTGGYVRSPEVLPSNFRDYFRDVPIHFEFTDYGIDTHYSLERNRREWYDPAGMAWVQDHTGNKDFLAEEFPWLKS